MTTRRYRGFPVDELIDDFRLACVSRAIDDREITMQKQSRVFFQISGAGHEAHRPGPGPAPAARLRLVLPLLPGPGAGARPRRHADRDPAAGGRARPTTRPRAAARCRRTGATRALNIVTQSSPTGSQCIPAVGCAEAGRYIVRRPQLPGCAAHGDELTYVSPRRGGVQRGRVLGEPQHRVQPPPAGALRRARQRLRHLGAGHRPAPGAGGRAGARLPRASRCTASTAPTTSRVRDAGPVDHRARAGRRRARRCIHADVVRPYSHSAADTQSKYRSADELADEAAPRPDRPDGGRAGRRRCAHRRARPPSCGPRPRRSWPRRPPRRWPRRRPDPARITEQVVRAARAVPAPPADLRGRRGRCRWARRSSARCTR